MVLLFAAFSCLASAISANKVILFSLSPEFLVGLRMTISSILLAGATSLRSKKAFPWKALKKVFSWLVIIALFTTFFPSNLKAYALAYMPSSKMAYFGTLDPFVAALYSYFCFQERLTLGQWCGILVGFAGMIILMTGSSPLEEQLYAFSIVSWPELAAFLAIVISRLGWIQAQQLLKREHVTPAQFTMSTMALGGLLSLCMAVVRGTTSIRSLSDSLFPVLKMSPISWLSPLSQLGFFLGYTILIGNMVGYTLYAHALKRYSATFIALSGFSIPLLVQVIGWLLLGEPLSVLFFVSCVVTFCGVVIFSLDEKSHRALPEPMDNK